MATHSDPAETVCNLACKVKTVKCERCGLAHHCQDHADRHSNLAQCFPVKVARSDSQGRHLLATRTIKPGEIVLQERPVVTGSSTMVRPQCLVCCREEYPK